MKILICGNIASGKGTLIKGVLEHLEDFEHLAIDDYRNKYGDGTQEGEDRAREQFIFDIRFSENCLVECTGVGKLFSMVRAEVDYRFLLSTKPEECEKRFNDRDTKVTLPSTWFTGKSLRSSIDDIDKLHNKTGYKLIVRNNKNRDVVKVVTKIKGLQRRLNRLH